MAQFKDCKFHGTTVVLDGHEYLRCEFSESKIEKGLKRGQFLILSTPRPASSGNTRDGSDNRMCPSSDARRSTPPSSSSPPTSAPPKALSLRSRHG